MTQYTFTRADGTQLGKQGVCMLSLPVIRAVYMLGDV